MLELLCWVALDFTGVHNVVVHQGIFLLKYTFASPAALKWAVA